MLKIVKNKGQCKHFRNTKHKYLLCTSDFGAIMYAKIGLKPIIGYIRAKMKWKY